MKLSLNEAYHVYEHQVVDYTMCIIIFNKLKFLFFIIKVPLYVSNLFFYRFNYDDKFYLIIVKQMLLRTRLR